MPKKLVEVGTNYIPSAEKGPQLRSRLAEILNVAQRVRLRFRLTCGLVGWPF